MRSPSTSAGDAGLRMRTAPDFVLTSSRAATITAGSRSAWRERPVRRAPSALLAGFGWAALACAAFPVVLPALPAYRTAVAAVGLLLFALALAAPRPAFAAALVAVTGAGASALAFGSREPASAGSLLLFAYLAGAALREVYEPHAPPFVSPVVSAWRAFAALSAVSGAATFVGTRTWYLLWACLRAHDQRPGEDRRSRLRRSSSSCFRSSRPRASRRRQAHVREPDGRLG